MSSKDPAASSSRRREQPAKVTAQTPNRTTSRIFMMIVNTTSLLTRPYHFSRALDRNVYDNDCNELVTHGAPAGREVAPSAPRRPPSRRRDRPGGRRARELSTPEFGVQIGPGKLGC